MYIILSNATRARLQQYAFKIPSYPEQNPSKITRKPIPTPHWTLVYPYAQPDSKGLSSSLSH